MLKRSPLRDAIGRAALAVTALLCALLPSSPGVADSRWVEGAPGDFMDGVAQGVDVSASPGSIRLAWLGEPGEYAREGSYLSAVFDAERDDAVWGAVFWSEVVPEGTDVVLEVRVGPTSLPDATWSPFEAFTEPQGGSLTAPPGRYAQYRVTLTSDGADTPALEALTIRYNRPPIVTNASPATVSEGGESMLGVAVLDLDGDPLTIDWDLDGDGEFDDARGETARYAPTLDGPATAEVHVRVHDGELEATLTVPLLVVNLPPTLGELAAPSAGVEGEPLLFAALAADPGGARDPLTFTWEWGDGTPNSMGFSVTHAYPGDGTWPLRLTVADDDGGSASWSQEVTIVNRAPTLLGVNGPATVGEGSPAAFYALAEDVPGDALTYTWSFEAGPSFSGAGLTTASHTWAADGVYTVTVTVADEDGGEVSATREVTVEDRPPVILALGGPTVIPEGTPARFFAEATDPGGDPLEYVWDFGDGGALERGGGLTEVLHAYDDDGDRVLTLTVEGDGAHVTRRLPLQVVNVAPRVVSDPPRAATVGLTTTYEVEVEDPGADPASCALERAPEGAALAGCVLTWRPDDRWITARPPVAPFELRVTDGDGGEDVQRWEVRVGFVDEDMDDVPDDCERAYGLDPTDPDDRDQDADMDGITNLRECLAGTNPRQFNGPTAPTLQAPEADAYVGTRYPTFAVIHAADPDDDRLTYAFALYRDEALTEPLYAVSDVPEGQGELTEWRSEVELDDNARIWWRARARDPFVASPWSEARALFIDTANESPSVPRPDAPVGVAATSQPTLRWDASVDPEEEALTYTVQVHRDEGLTELAQEESGITDTAWRVATPLAEDGLFWWRVSAQDARGRSSAFSEPLMFRINASNRPPPAPELISPDPLNPIGPPAPIAITWGAVTDPDGDPVSYDVELAEDQSFATLLLSVMGREDDGSATYTEPVERLPIGVPHWVRVRARDLLGVGEWTVARFTYGVSNRPPNAPALTRPLDGAIVDAGDVELVFAPTSDPDGDELTYIVRVWGDQGRGDEVFSETASGLGESITVTWRDVVGPAAFWWSVTAVDPGGQSAESALGGFLVALPMNQPPDAPTLLSPRSGEQVEVAGFDLVLSNATDPEGDPLTYTFEIYTDAALTQLLALAADVRAGEGGQTRAEVQGLNPKGNATLYWRAFATDDRGNEGPASARASFTVDDPGSPDDPEEDTGAALVTGSGCAAQSVPRRPSPPSLIWVALAGLLWARRR